MGAYREISILSIDQLEKRFERPWIPLKPAVGKEMEEALGERDAVLAKADALGY